MVQSSNIKGITKKILPPLPVPSHHFPLFQSILFIFCIFPELFYGFINLKKKSVIFPLFYSTGYSPIISTLLLIENRGEER